MVKDSKIAIRCSKETRDKLKEIAEKEDRTLSNLISKILKDYLETK